MMNKNRYRLVFSRIQKMWVAVAEHCRTGGKGGRSRATMLGAAALLVSVWGSVAQAQCVSGGGAYSCSGATVTGVTIRDDNAAVTTQPGFSVDATTGNALTIQGNGAISYIDQDAATLTTTGRNGLSVTSTGDVGGVAGSVTVQTNGDITGANAGIIVNNGGSSSTSITATGKVSATVGTGIYAQNQTGAADMTVSAQDVTGNNTGVFVRNNGTGQTSVTVSGVATGGATGNGVFALAGSASTGGVTVDVAAASGGVHAVYVENRGGGATTVSASGPLTGLLDSSNGLYALAGASSTGLTVNAADVTVGRNGIYAENNGSGATNVVVAGTVTSGGTGIDVWNKSSNSTDLHVTANSVVAQGANGIRARNLGTGAVSVATTGTVSGNVYGINIQGGGGGSVNLTADGDVSGGKAAIFAQSSNNQTITITTNGSTQATSGQASDLVVLASGAPMDYINNGTLTGRVQTDELGGSTLTNNGTWNTASGVSGNAEVGLDAVVNNGTINFLQTDGAYAFAAAISGVGGINQNGAGTTILTAQNTYSGRTTVMSGTLQAGAANTLSANSIVDVHSGASVLTLGQTQTIAGLVNAGTVNLTSSAAQTLTGNVLNVSGDYVGDGGTVIMTARWNGKGNAHDQLNVGGDASGQTALQVLHHQGAGGGESLNLVSVGGTSTTDAFVLSPLSDGYRHGASEGMVVVGPYNYVLKQGGYGGKANDWYLVSASDGGYRPEVGAYLDNRFVAMSSQWHTLQDRQGQSSGTVGDGSTFGGQSWMRVQGDFSKRKSSHFRSRNDSYLLHFGSDIARWDVGDGSLRIGAMTAIVRSSGSTQARGQEGGRANQSLNGVSVGAYASWFGSTEVGVGPYVDTWLMGGRFSSKVSGDGLASERYYANAYSASIEAGYGLTLYQQGTDQNATRVMVQPQIQVIASKYRADNHTEQSGIKVSGLNAGAVSTRIGARVYADIPQGAQSSMRPYLEMNWWHGPSSRAITFDGVAVRDKLPANRGELKLGLDGHVTNNLTLWGGIGVQKGSGYTDKVINVGVGYRW